MYQIKQNEKTLGNHTSSARPWEIAEQRNRYRKNIFISISFALEESSSGKNN